MLSMTEPTSSLRQHYRSQRRALSAQQQADHSQLLAQHLLQFESLQSAGRIACYLANDGEIDPAVFVEAAWSRNQQVYLPVLADSEDSLLFAPYTANCNMQPNRFGIDEPVCASEQHVQASELDTVLLPLVAFDGQGNRMGMGGGFYDRTLAFRIEDKTLNKPFLIGLAHEIQRSEQLQSASWDVPLDAIATENSVLMLG